MSLNLKELCRLMEIDTRPIGVYDAPDPTPFAPLVGLKRCVFDHYADWQNGQTLDVSGRSRGCPGCGYWMRGVQGFPSKEAFVKFLAEKEGLRASSELMEAWVDATPPYQPVNEHVLIGPVRDETAEYLKTVTFFVNPDQMSVLMHGAVYHAHPDDPAPVLAPFGSGCGQMLALFPNPAKPQALIGATDLAMRGLLPAERLAFTVTVPMLDRLLSLDPQQSFLGKPFLRKLREARSK
jgi:hypothetical protein